MVPGLWASSNNVYLPTGEEETRELRTQRHFRCYLTLAGRLFSGLLRFLPETYGPAQSLRGTSERLHRLPGPIEAYRKRSQDTTKSQIALSKLNADRVLKMSEAGLPDLERRFVYKMPCSTEFVLCRYSPLVPLQNASGFHSGTGNMNLRAVPRNFLRKLERYLTRK